MLYYVVTNRGRTIISGAYATRADALYHCRVGEKIVHLTEEEADALTF
jgi:hypothetical protein